MDNETLARHNFLFILLLIPFLVIDLSIKTIIMLPKISPLMRKLLYV